MSQPPVAMLLRMAKSTGMVALGTGLGQVFILGSTPLLTRIYSTDQFGQLALLLSVSGIVMAGGCLRYELALPGAEERDAVSLFILCGALATLLASLAFLLCLLPWYRWFSHPILHLTRTPWLVAGLVVGVAIYQAAGAFLVREGRFMSLAALRTSQGLIFASLAALPLFGLLWSHVFSFLVGGVILGAWLYLNHGSQVRAVNRGRLLETAKHYKKFPIYLLPGAILDIVGVSACLWIISSIYGLSQAGQYSQIQRLIGAPMLLISASLSQVMLKHSSDEQRAQRPLWPLVKNLAIVLGAFCTGLIILLFFFGSWGLHLFLGPKWRVDTYFICIVALAMFVRSTVSPLSAILLATRRLRPCLIWQSCYFLSSASILPWIAIHTSFDRFLLGYAIHECIHYLIYFLIIRFAAKVPRYSEALVGVPVA